MVTACFKEKSTFIRCLIFLVSVLIMILVALSVILVNQKKDNHVCKSDHCINLSAQVMRYTEKSVTPCNDFHAFVCGGLLKNKREHSPPSAEEEVKQMIMQMVQTGDSKPFILQKSFYLSCSNLASVEMDDDETLLDLFFSVGDWPVLRGAHWDGTFFEWTDIAIKNRRIGLKFDWFLDFTVYKDVNDTGKNYLRIDVPPLTPMKHEEILPKQRLLTDVAVILGAPEKLAHYETGRTIDFENALATLADEHRNKKTLTSSLRKLSINEVQALWPNIRWQPLINNITGLNLISSDLIIFDQVLDYIENLNSLIYGTPKRIVADYMMWKIVEEYWPYLSRPVREKFEEFNDRLYNRLPELDRLKFCINESRKQFPLIAESEYIRRHVTQEKRELVKEMVFIIRNKFIQLVRRATWINKEARQNALFKLENMEFLVGGPRQVFDEYGFAEDFGVYGFAFKSGNVIDMLTERKRRFYDNYFGAVNKMATNTTQGFYEKIVNISRFTVINGNTLVIPAAVLRDVFYNPKLPNYFNYATLGTTIVKAIFEHVFLQNNKTIIDEENENYNSFWTADAFDTAVKCLIKEYSFMLNRELKRSKSMRALLEEFVGAEVAYEAYQEWSLLHPQEFKLPGLEFTPKQLFWIHTSKLSCTNKIYLKHDRDYSSFKIIGPLRNSRNFATDYNCTEGTKMFTRRQCRIL